eukprot:14541273-Ditylum_brightwellii.AAC.1
MNANIVEASNEDETDESHTDALTEDIAQEELCETNGDKMEEIINHETAGLLDEIKASETAGVSDKTEEITNQETSGALEEEPKQALDEENAGVPEENQNKLSNDKTTGVSKEVKYAPMEKTTDAEEEGSTQI